MRPIFLKKGDPIFSIKLGQTLPKSFSQLHVKKSRLFLLYILKKEDWPKVYAGPRLPALTYSADSLKTQPKCVQIKIKFQKKFIDIFSPGMR